MYLLHSTESQVEFFKMLDRKIEEVGSDVIKTKLIFKLLLSGTRLCGM